MLDLACGCGVLARYTPKEIAYCGIDISATFIQSAKTASKQRSHRYYVADVTQALPIKKQDFTHAAILLALQNIQHPQRVFANAFAHLKMDGVLVIALNHPCFRIPRQSSWGVDMEKKIQYRRIDRYSSALEIPIHTHPGKGDRSPTTLSFHYPLAAYSQWLFQEGFVIELIEEWHSNKVSSGKMARQENRSREEIPLFLAIRARKTSRPSP